MAKLTVFNFLSVNGFYKGPDEDISWHIHGGDEAEFSAQSLGAGNTLLFGRITYEMMKAFWPADMAIEKLPQVAIGMNNAEKIVFSNTITSPGWKNVKVIGGDIITATKKLKETSVKGMTILGSGTILTQFAEAGLIDEYQFMIDPVVIGKGTAAFSGLKQNLSLELINARQFKSGIVLLTYKPKIN